MICEIYCNGHKIGSGFHVQCDTAVINIRRAALARMSAIMDADPDTAAHGGEFRVDVVLDGESAGVVTIGVGVDITTPA